MCRDTALGSEIAATDATEERPGIHAGELAVGINGVHGRLAEEHHRPLPCLVGLGVGNQQAARSVRLGADLRTIDGRPQGHDRFGGLLRRVFPDRFLAKSPKSRRSAGNGPVSRPRLHRLTLHNQPTRIPAQAESQRRAAEFGRRLWRETEATPTP